MTAFSYPGYKIYERDQTERLDSKGRLRISRHIDATPDDSRLSLSTASYYVGARRPGHLTKMFSKEIIEGHRQNAWACLTLLLRQNKKALGI